LEMQMCRKRPGVLRALGNQDPPLEISINGKIYRQQEIYKHDSWAATATYQSDGHIVVCKFNRQFPIFCVPMRWLGRALGRRETYFLTMLKGTPGIPKSYNEVIIKGIPAPHVSAHDFIQGQPLTYSSGLHCDFFENLDRLIRHLHSQRIAYVDLHKRENILVGIDGLPYLIDFQISVSLPNVFGLNWLFLLFAKSDLYHLEKHRQVCSCGTSASIKRPWWIQMHRRLTLPWRSLRRRFLVLIGVRKGKGYANSEIAVEVGLRHRASA
ncbi:MAG TPA: hypothetical protein VM260_21190, partial [Pirellula sp.]|nr:hypothetical protein [Pirellula sp.]